MANRTEQKRKLRQERVAREAAAKASEQRRRRLLTLAATTVAALAVVGVLIAVSQSGGQRQVGARCRRGGDRHTHRAGPVPRNPAERRDAREPERPGHDGRVRGPAVPLLRGLHAQHAASIVRRYVRPGKLKLELRPVSILGDGLHHGGRRGRRRRPEQPGLAVHRSLLPQPGTGEQRLRDRQLPARHRARSGRGSRRRDRRLDESSYLGPLAAPGRHRSPERRASTVPRRSSSGAPAGSSSALQVSSYEPAQFATAIDRVLGQ